MNKTIIVLGGALLAVIIVGTLIIFLLPSGNQLDPSAQTGPPAENTTNFNTNVLQKPEYLRLNQQPIREGAVPVQPPAVVGKANPFI